jgi:kynurenine formamidase
MGQRIVDLSLTLRMGMRGVGMEPNTSIADTGYNTTNLRLLSHAGTHMDAPRHFLDDGGSIDAMSLDRCVGPALVVDLSHKEPHSLITVDDLVSVVARVRPGVRLLLRTGWDGHVHLPDFRTHFPRISPELARWLVQRKVALLGVQSPSVASLRPEDHAELVEVHQTLLRGGVVIVEGLANLSDLRRDEVQFIALPLKLEGCDGSPVRAIAIEEDDD